MTAPTTGVVVVHWRGMRDTRECLESLASADGARIDVVVVTNGPGDFDQAQARAAYPAVTVIASPVNGGYAAACNLGARELLRRGAEIVVLLNNDVSVDPGAILLLAGAFAADERIGIAGPVVVYYDDPGRIWSAGGRLHSALGYTQHWCWGAPVATARDRGADFVSGSAMAIRRAVFERLGGLEESYFHYFEDVDFCERAREAGYSSCVVGASVVRHKVSAAAGVRGSNRLNRVQAYYFSRNRTLFVRRNFAGFRRLTAMFAQIAMLLPYEAVKALGQGNLSEARGRVEGLIDGMRGRSGARGGGL